MGSPDMGVSGGGGGGVPELSLVAQPESTNKNTQASGKVAIHQGRQDIFFRSSIAHVSTGVQLRRFDPSSAAVNAILRS